MNEYFYKIWVPLHIITLVAIVAAIIGYVDVNWWVVFGVWFFIGPVGNGLGFHRLFAHRQFETWRPVEVVLAWLGTYASYAPVLFWTGIHQQHHKTSDTPEDLSSPAEYGFMEAFFWYRLRKAAIKAVDLRNYCSRRILRDTFLMWISKHFFKIVWCIIIFWTIVDALGIFSSSMLLSAYLLPVLIEQIRLNTVSSFTHMDIPGSYKVFETKDHATNNIFLGYLTFGFGWHNAHHHNPRELVNTHRWWELDIEGLIGKLLSKDTWQKNA